MTGLNIAAAKLQKNGARAGEIVHLDNAYKAFAHPAYLVMREVFLNQLKQSLSLVDLLENSARAFP